jgi:hypothetical protein
MAAPITPHITHTHSVGMRPQVESWTAAPTNRDCAVISPSRIRVWLNWYHSTASYIVMA